MTIVFPTHDAFVTERGLDPDRVDSYDYGVWWRDQTGGVYRLTWIGPRARPAGAGDPGELYLLALQGSLRDSVEFLCVIPPVGAEPPFDANVEGILDGWGEVCGTENSTDWIRDRVREAVEAGWARKSHTRHVEERR